MEKDIKLYRTGYEAKRKGITMSFIVVTDSALNLDHILRALRDTGWRITEQTVITEEDLRS